MVFRAGLMKPYKEMLQGRGDHILYSSHIFVNNKYVLFMKAPLCSYRLIDSIEAIMEAITRQPLFQGFRFNTNPAVAFVGEKVRDYQ